MNELQIAVKRAVERTGVKPPYICLLCGTVNAKDMEYGAFIPRDADAKARLFMESKITVWLWSYCKFCQKQPDLIGAVDRKLATGLSGPRVVKVDLPMPQFVVKSKQ